MKQILLVTVLVSSMAFFTSCDTLMQVAGSVAETASTGTSSSALTTQEVIQGLKEALKLGADTAVSVLNKTDGYYKDALVKIALPSQVSQVVEYAQKVPGLESLIEEAVLQINRSAEDAAAQAAPVFKDAITSMSFADAWSILKGADNAATVYLQDKTTAQLVELYKPIVQNSLNKPLVANISAQKSWDNMTKKWNSFANSVAGKLVGANAVNIELDEYVTEQALNGMFIKVADQEKNIRTDVSARTSSLLKKVFGNTTK